MVRERERGHCDDDARDECARKQVAPQPAAPERVGAPPVQLEEAWPKTKVEAKPSDGLEEVSWKVTIKL